MTTLTYFIRPIVFGLLLWGTCVYAFRRGDRDMKIAAVGMFLDAYATLFVAGPAATRFHDVETPVLFADLALLALLLWLTLRSQRFWPMWLTAMHGTATLAHLTGLLPHLPWAYGTAVALWMYPMLILLCFAIRRHDRARRQGDMER